MHASTPEITRTVTPDGDLLVVEAIAVEDALAAVPGATEDDVVEVERVLRGGVRGFFAKEMFVVTLRPPGRAVEDAADATDEDHDEVPDRYVVDARPTGIDAVIAQMAAQEDSRELSFGALLQQHLRPAETPAQAAGVAPRDPAPATAPTVASAVADTPTAPVAEPARTLRHPVEAARPTLRAWQPPRLEPAAVAPTTAVPTAPTTAPTTGPDAAPAVTGLAAAVVAELARGTEVQPAPRPRAAAGSGIDEAVAAAVAPAPDVWTLDVVDLEPVAWPAPAPRTATTPPAAAPPVAPVPTAAAPAAPAPVALVDRGRTPHRRAASTGVAWDVRAMLELGIPESLLADLPPIDLDDEYAWMRALAAAVSPLCRPLPTGDAILAGPAAGQLALSMDVPILGETPFLTTDLAALTVRDDEGSRSWFHRARGDRWLHLVVGGGSVGGLRNDDPLAVSWVGDEALPEALRLAARGGLVLGYGLDPSRGTTGLRAHPIDIAVAIRRMLPRRTPA